MVRILNVSINYYNESITDVTVRFEVNSDKMNLHGTLMLSPDEYEENKEIAKLETLVTEHLKEKQTNAE